MRWIIAILIFSLLIIVHEFGHFLLAKINGVEVEEFSIGFGPRLFSTKFHGTRYSLKVLLFGGSCRMKSMLEDYDEEEGGEEMLKPEEGDFEGVSPGRRAAILFAGPFFNFLLAFVCAILVIGSVGYDPAKIAAVPQGSPAAEAGLQEGDVITSFMGKRVDIGRDLSTWFIFHDLKKDQTIPITYERDGRKRETLLKPGVEKRYVMGISYNLDTENALIQAVQEGSPLQKAGLLAGDVITAVDGQKIGTAASLSAYFKDHPLDGSPVRVSYLRDGSKGSAEVIPAQQENLVLGFSYNLNRVRTTPVRVLRYSFIEMRYWITSTVESIAGMFTGRFGINDLSGPVGVVDIVGRTYEESRSQGAVMTIMNLLNLIILLSTNLGVMNLLPIPAIDGGRLVGTLLEAIRGRRVSVKVESTVTLITATLLVLLMVYVMYHDIVTMIRP